MQHKNIKKKGWNLTYAKKKTETWLFYKFNYLFIIKLSTK